MQKGGCSDRQPPSCDGERPKCADGTEKGPCKNKQPPVCEGGAEPLCSDGLPAPRPKPKTGKMEKQVCQDKSTPSCKDGSTAKCADGSDTEKAKCEAAWLCDDKKREMCEDGKFPRILHVKDPKKQGRNRPVKRPPVGAKEDIEVDVSDEVK